MNTWYWRLAAVFMLLLPIDALADDKGTLVLNMGFEVNSSSSTGDIGGTTYLVGYEFADQRKVRLGVEFSRFNDSLNSLNYDALYLTMRPENVKYLQSKIGLVTGPLGTGGAIGVSLTSDPNKFIKIHWLDFQFFTLGGYQFTSWNVSAFSIIVVLGVIH